VASGLVRDSERTWFSELSDKGRWDKETKLLCLQTFVNYNCFGKFPGARCAVVMFFLFFGFSEMYQDPHLLCNEKLQW